ncbi:MAG: DUF948 domain-containing protein [Gemmatimonadaceae bacterium]
MTFGWALDGSWLLPLQQIATLPDTFITRQVTADPGMFQKVTSVAQGLMTVAVLVLTVALVPAAWNFRKSYKRVSDLLDRVYGDISPIMRHASTVADNLNYVTTSLRADVQQVSQTVASANQRVLLAAQLAERRLEEFNALLDVVQEEAEDTFVSAASAVRGMRVGADRYQAELRSAAAAARLDDLDEELGEALDDVFDPEEQDDGDDAGEDDTRTAEHPRVRPRGRA